MIVMNIYYQETKPLVTNLNFLKNSSLLSSTIHLRKYISCVFASQKLCRKAENLPESTVSY